MTNKWRRRARKWRKEARAYKGYYIDTDLALKTERIQNALAGPASGAAAALNGYYIDTDLALKTERIQNALAGPASGAAAALNKAEELRRDNISLSTELARVQGECEATQAQVLIHAATIVDLRERDRVSGQNFRALMSEKEALLAWQRRAGEATNTLAEFQCEGAPVAFFSEAYLYPLVGKEDARTLLHRVRMLREAIEAGAEPKGET